MKIKCIIWVVVPVLCAAVVGALLVSDYAKNQLAAIPLKQVAHPEVAEPDSRTELTVSSTSNKTDYAIARSEQGRNPILRFTLQELEGMAQLPRNAWPEEEKLAESTSWWGKPLDPKEYWRNRPLWIDAETSWSANARGRLHPPIPFDDQEMLELPAEDTRKRGYAGIEGYTPAYVSNPRERNFWAKWYSRLPQPPQKIDVDRLRAAQLIMSIESRSRQPKQRGQPTTAADVTRYWETVGRSAISDGGPPEAFERSCIYVAFILNVYTKQGSSASNELNNWRGIIPNEYLDASEAKLREMDKAWKHAYINRLKNELSQHPQLAPFVDEYIKAYSEAWTL